MNAVSFYLINQCYRQTGDIDILAFIGGSKAADALIKSHPNPHKLKVFLQLEGKNLGIVLPDADLDLASEQITIGSTTFNGQRCTAIKLVLVHRSVVEDFLPKFIQRISALRVGLPWDPKVEITPLPEKDKPKYLQDLIDDSVAYGAKIVNSDCGGGELSGSLMTPAILYPVNSSMRVWYVLYLNVVFYLLITLLGMKNNSVQSFQWQSLTLNKS